MYRILFSPEAEEHLLGLRAYERRLVLNGMDLQLKTEPDIPTRNRKQMRPNPFATWELRIGQLRVYYDIDADENVVWIVALGTKQRNKVVVGKKEIQL